VRPLGELTAFYNEHIAARRNIRRTKELAPIVSL